MRSVLLTVCFLCCAIPAGATFDYVISDTYEHGTLFLNNESLLVTGGGAYEIIAREYSYIEVQGTAPLQVDVGGIGSLLLDDNSAMNYFGGETGGIRFYTLAPLGNKL